MVRRRAAATVLVLLSVQFAVFAGIEAWRDAVTVDESVYLSAGITALTRHDLRLNPEHPPLGKVLAAAPALLARPVVPAGASWKEARQFDYSAEFVVAQRRAGRLHWVVFAGRMVPIIEAIVAGLLLYAIGSRFFGGLGGLVAAGIWLTSPWVVGLGHLSSIDLHFTVSTLALVLALAAHLRKPSLRSVVVLGLCGGAALLTRFTGLVAVPVAAATAALAVDTWWRRLTVAGAVLVVAWACVWLGIRVVSPHGPSARQREIMAKTAEAGRDVSALARVVQLVPWPIEYEAGVGYQALVAGPRPVFLWGRSWTGRQWWYWPAAFVIKWPLPTVGMLAAGTVAWLRRPGRRVGATCVLPVAGALGIFTLAQPAQIGLRYMMPVVALGLVVAAGGIAGFGRRLRTPVLWSVAFVQVASLWSASPHSLAWTSPPFRPGYRFAADSNLDWGQDIGRFEEWARGRDVYAWLFGSLGTDTVAGLAGVRPLKGVSLPDIHGWVAASASVLTAYRRDELAWLRKYCAVADIGGTILIYRFLDPPSPEPGPAAPVPPCHGSPASMRR